MCGSTADIQSAAAEIRRKKEEERTNHSMKIYMVSLFHRATINNILFIDVLASRRKPSSGLTSVDGRQYVKACPIRDSTGSSPRLNSCCRSS